MVADFAFVFAFTENTCKTINSKGDQNWHSEYRLLIKLNIHM